MHDLRRRVEEAFAGEGPAWRMHIDVVSFGFKKGVPRVVDVLLDVRFLPNPYWLADLRPLSGLDESVADYVLGHDDAGEFLERSTGMFEFLVPRYEAEGKSYLTIGIGCTGGIIGRWPSPKQWPRCCESGGHSRSTYATATCLLEGLLTRVLFADKTKEGRPTT